jgi:tetratricopeptide (TPR) repeat protein
LEQAFAMAQRAITLDNSLPVAHGLLSMVYAQKQQYDQALAEGERTIALDPNSADSYAQQAEVLNYAGRPEEALRSVEQAMRLNPRYPAWYLIESGWAYRLTGQYEEAIAALKTLLLRNPNFLAAYLHLFDCYLAQWAFQLSPDPQTLEQAFEAAQRTIALNNSASWTHAILGYAYLWQKQYEQAHAELERAIALDPNFAASYALQAQVFSYAGRPEEASRLVEQATRLGPVPGYDWHFYNLGSAYYLAGRTEEAIAPLKKFLTLYPNFLGAHLTLAAVYSELGREAEARAEAAEVLRINPNFSLEIHRQRVPLKDPAVLERHLAALRTAGLK